MGDAAAGEPPYFRWAARELRYSHGYYIPHLAVYLPLKSRSRKHPVFGCAHPPVATVNGAVRTPNTGPTTGMP